MDIHGILRRIKYRLIASAYPISGFVFDFTFYTQ